MTEFLPFQFIIFAALPPQPQLLLDVSNSGIIGHFKVFVEELKRIQTGDKGPRTGRTRTSSLGKTRIPQRFCRNLSGYSSSISCRASVIHSYSLTPRRPNRAMIGRQTPAIHSLPQRRRNEPRRISWDFHIFRKFPQRLPMCLPLWPCKYVID